MIVLVEDRPLVAGGFEALFEREGVALVAMSPSEFADWIGGADAADIEAVAAVLLGGVAGDDCADGSAPIRLAEVRSRTEAPVIALAEGPRLEATLSMFALGCDDVVRAPVHPREILARAAAIRCRRRAEADPSLRFGALTVHVDGRDPLVGGEPMALPRRERRVLEVLASARGRFVTKAQLFSSVYGLFRTDIEESVVESHVSKLRRKLRATLGSDPIEARRFQGYAFRVSADGAGRPQASVAA